MSNVLAVSSKNVETDYISTHGCITLEDQITGCEDMD
jgi:hypothetical protein